MVFGQKTKYFGNLRKPVWLLFAKNCWIAKIICVCPQFLFMFSRHCLKNQHRNRIQKLFNLAPKLYFPTNTFSLFDLDLPSITLLKELVTSNYAICCKIFNDCIFAHMFDMGPLLYPYSRATTTDIFGFEFNAISAE